MSQKNIGLLPIKNPKPTSASKEKKALPSRQFLPRLPDIPKFPQHNCDTQPPQHNIDTLPTENPKPTTGTKENKATKRPAPAAWTKEEAIEMFRYCFKRQTGMPIKELAEKLGRTERSCHAKLQRMDAALDGLIGSWANEQSMGKVKSSANWSR